MARGKGRTVAVVLDVVFFILLEMAAFSILRRDGPLQEMWFLKKLHIVTGTAWGWTDQIRQYFSLRKQNDQLAAENQDLLRRLDEAEASRQALLSASATALLPPSRDFRFIPASILKISRNRQRNYLILDKGSEDGVTPHSGIVTSLGVVGIVDAVSEHRCLALSLMNPEVVVSCRLGREGSVGPLSWDGAHVDGALLRGIPIHVEQHPGDTVYTSGVSAVFPADIPLGVTGESRISDGATSEVKVRLFQDFSTLRHVSVVCNLRRAEEQALEQKAVQP